MKSMLFPAKISRCHTKIQNEAALYKNINGRHRKCVTLLSYLNLPQSWQCFPYRAVNTSLFRTIHIPFQGNCPHKRRNKYCPLTRHNLNSLTLGRFTGELCPANLPIGWISKTLLIMRRVPRHFMWKSRNQISTCRENEDSIEDEDEENEIVNWKEEVWWYICMCWRYSTLFTHAGLSLPTETPALSDLYSV